MKIKPIHIEEMRAGFATFIAENKDAVRAHRLQLATSGKVKNVDMRMRWDILYACKGSAWVCDSLYPYANASHIDTALRMLQREFNV